ncbi:MAG: hypothetical protein WC476_06080 [Phycisphaerae bacterium]
MKKKKLLIAIGLLLVLLILKIVLLLTAEPKITVDYVAEYNRITCPENYDPNDNAAPYYQKAFDAFVEMPKELQEVPYIIGWVADFNNTEQALLEKWLVSNTLAFEYFKIAANKPYYWLEVDEYFNKYNFSLKCLTDAILWNAKLEASEGRLQTAFENIIDCYKAGWQKCRTPSLLTEQKVGLEIKLDAVCGTMVILDRAQLDSMSLKSFNDALQTEFNNDTYVLDFAADKLFCYDGLQRSFVYNGKGTGRLAFCKIKNFLALCGEEYNRKVFLSCFIGPTESEMVKRIEELFASFEPVTTETPWQLHTQEPGYLEKIDITCYKDPFLGMYAPSPRREFSLYHLVKAKTEALIAIAAILRFKTDKGQFPATLDEVVSSGYLESVPMDPYSDGLLVYKLTEDNFKLYSVGEDFIDDNGETNVKTDNEPRRDILFWPVRRLENLREKSEKQKAEREAKARKELEEANHPE